MPGRASSHVLPLCFLSSVVLLGALLGSACSRQPADSSPPHAAEPARPSTATSTTLAQVADANVSPADAAAAPTAAATAAPTPVTETPEPPIKVKVVTIGMHVGGGPYDEVTKEPMKRSVEPRFADLARCWKHVVTHPKPADVGVDLVIEASGGHARVSNPRTSVTGEGFVPCVVAFFESVDFQKPNNGKTVVSYSVRFSP